jgi:hypothetical protein
LRILEEFRKNHCVKIPPKSPCANFQSPDKLKKIQFLFQKGISFSFWPSRPNRPTSLLGLLAHPAHPTLFFLPVLNRAGTAAAGLAPPPRATSASPAMEPLPQALHFMPMHNFSLVGELFLHFTL